MVSLANANLLLDAAKDLKLISLTTDEINSFFNMLDEVLLVEASLIILDNVLTKVGFQVVHNSSGEVNECVVESGFGGPVVMCSDLEGSKLSFFGESDFISRKFTIKVNSL